MDNIDNHLKPQQTGGLKLMTVFIAVLALHVVVIGGFTVYHLMSGGATDNDLVTDKTHKGVKVATDADATAPDATAAPDKTATATPAATTPTPAPAADASTASTPPPDATDTAATSTPAPAPATPAPLAPPPETPAVTIATPAPVSAPAPAPMVNASTPSGPMASGPVITPIETPNGPANADVPPAEQEAVALDGDVPAAPTSYVVKPHDSLAKIARAHHLTLAKLREANNLNSDLLHIGQKLVLPAGNESAVTTATKPAAHHHASHEPDRTLLGDSIPDSAVQKPVLSTPHDQALMTTSSGHHLYTVLKGDTLAKIAHKFHTTRSTLVAMNSALEDHKLHAGQKLRVPSTEPRSANVTPAPASTPSAPRAQPAEIQPRSTPSAQLANFMP
jgi:LysM repeat protein